MKLVQNKAAAEKAIRQAPSISLVSNDFRVPFAGDVWYKFKWGTHRVILITRPFKRGTIYVALPLDIVEVTAKSRWRDSWTLHGKSVLSRDYIRLLHFEDRPANHEYKNAVSRTDIPRWNGDGEPPKCPVEGIGDWALLTVETSQVTSEGREPQELIEKIRKQYEFLLAQAQAL